MKLRRRTSEDRTWRGCGSLRCLLVAKAVLVADPAQPGRQRVLGRGHPGDHGRAPREPGHRRGHPAGTDRAEHQGRPPPEPPELAEALTELAATARAGKRAPSDITGGTITITNVGVFGVDTGTPILNPGEAAILAFGAVRHQPWVHKGKVGPRQVTTLALSFDHRLVDGELGSRFLSDVGAMLADPGMVLAMV